LFASKVNINSKFSLLLRSQISVPKYSSNLHNLGVAKLIFSLQYQSFQLKSTDSIENTCSKVLMTLILKTYQQYNWD